MAKRLRFDPLSPTAFTGLIRVNPEVLMVEETNKCGAKEEEDRLHMDKASAEENSVKKKVA